MLSSALLLTTSFLGISQGRARCLITGLRGLGLLSCDFEDADMLAGEPQESRRSMPGRRQRCAARSVWEFSSF